MSQKAHVFETEIRKTLRLNYLLHLPKDYDARPNERWRMILFLHGAGERGTDVALVKVHGIPKIVEQQDDFPFITIAPQCPADWWWASVLEGEAVINLLNFVLANYRADPDRVYLTGLSMGGFGAWYLAAMYPDRFAAVVPICGGSEPHTAQRFKHIPTWAFHGAKDDVVPLAASKTMVNALKDAGGDVRFTVYPEAGHDSWTETYDNPELYTWLLSHRRRRPSE